MNFAFVSVLILDSTASDLELTKGSKTQSLLCLRPVSGSFNIVTIYKYRTYHNIILAISIFDCLISKPHTFMVFFDTKKTKILALLNWIDFKS